MFTLFHHVYNQLNAKGLGIILNSAMYILWSFFSSLLESPQEDSLLTLLVIYFFSVQSVFD